MTNRGKLFQLNAEFQRLYFDKELGFFHATFPAKLNEWIVFLSTLVKDKSHKHYSNFENYKNTLKDIIEDTKNKRLDYPSGNESVKDFHLIEAKRSIAQITWWAFKDLSISDTDVLEQII